MKLFIFNNVEKLTNNWHSEGGLVIIAESMERAIELATKEGVKFTKEEIESCEVRDCSGEEDIFLFPDAGCC